MSRTKPWRPLQKAPASIAVGVNRMAVMLNLLINTVLVVLAALGVAFMFFALWSFIQASGRR